MDEPSDSSPLFRPFALDGLVLRNRIIRAGCFEGMSQGGMVTSDLIEHHRRVAAGGVAMTTLSYCAVSADGRAFGHELWMRPEIVGDLRRLVAAVHGEGAAACIQLGHCGYFSAPPVIGRRPLGPSAKFCLYRLSRSSEMTHADIRKKIRDFVRAASLAREAGFDAIEIHAGHGYLLSQFASPWTNQRRDEYGGSLANRLRLACEVVREIRAEVGPGYPLIVKMNVRDGMRRGLEPGEAVIAAQMLASAGASALVPSCGFTSKTPLFMLRGKRPLREMLRLEKGILKKLGLALFGRMAVKQYPFKPLFLLEEARRIKDAVNIPVGYVGGVLSRGHMESLLAEGFAFIQVGRATIRDPEFVLRLARGEIQQSDCDQCNRCVAAINVGAVTCFRETDNR